MIVVTGEAVERRGLLVQFHEEDLLELQAALDAFDRAIRLEKLRDISCEKRFPWWARRLDAAIIAKLNDNRRFP